MPPGTPSPQQRDFVEALSQLLPSDRITTRQETLSGLSRDKAETLEPGKALVAVFPITSNEVAKVLRLATAYRTPVVPRGAGSGLAGGANAVDGCVVLSLARMDAIREIDVSDLVAVVEPGVINARLAAEVARHGLMFAPDPSSFDISSIGGNLATNAGGLRCVKYGVTREATLGLEVALADGSLLRAGRRTVKGVTGYDLVGLFVGSEGTLGVITEATLRLRPAPPTPGTVLAMFSTLADAAAAVASVSRAGPSVLELMDQTTLRAIEAWRSLGLDTSCAAALLARSDTADAGHAELAAVEAACREAGATDIMRSSDALESEGLMDARRAALPALERLGITLLEDVAVPRSRVVELVGVVERIAAAHDLVIPRGDAGAQTRALAAADEILATTLRLGGTLTGEHGIGILKRDRLEDELGPVGLRVSRAVKHALDPLGIMNPGKVLPLDAGG